MRSDKNCCSVSLIEPQSAWNKLVGSNAGDLNGLFFLIEMFKQLLAGYSLGLVQMCGRCLLVQILANLICLPS